MVRPIKLVTTITGDDAVRFLEEMDRTESLKPTDKEYQERNILNIVENLRYR